MIRLDAEALFARTLDLAPLRGRRRGLVRCRFHDDTSASLSVDLARGVFHCFGCGAEGGLRRFAELVGDVTASARSTGPRESELQRARSNVWRDEARRIEERREWLTALFDSCDHVRRSVRAADAARCTGTSFGDTPEAWHLLELAAAAERDALDTEGALDAILADGRVT